MTCKQCGAELDKRAKFCYACGAPVEEHEATETERPEAEPAEPVGTEAEPEVTETEPVEREAPEPEEEQPTEAVPPDGAPTPADDFAADTVAFDEPEEEPRKRSRLPVIIGAAAAVVVVALVGLVFGLGGSGGAQIRAATPADRLVSFSSDDTTVYLVDGQVVYAGEEAKYKWTTLDWRQMSVLTKDGTLYWADRKGVEQIEYDVDNVVYAINGGGLLYVQESTGSIGDLYYYDRAAGESVQVAEHVYHACISPDGKSYAYTYIEDDEVLCDLVTDGGEPERLEDNIIPIAVADSADYLYYAKIKDDDSALYVRTPEEDVKLVGDLNKLSKVYFTRSLDELLFLFDGSVYISRHGGDRQKLVTESTAVLVDTVNNQGRYEFDTPDIDTYVINTNTFAGHMLNSFEKVYLLYEDDAETLVNKSMAYYPSPVASDDGRKLAYVNERRRLMLIDVAAEIADAELVASNVEDFATSSDLSQFYIIDEEGTAFSVEPGESPQRAAYDIKWIIHSGDTDLWYLLSDEGMLYYCAFGEKPVRIQTPDDVYRMFIVGKGLYVYLGDEDSRDVYYLPKPDGELIPVLEDIR